MSAAAPSRSRARVFEGLPPTAFVFFAELAAHNDRGWFAANAEIYRTEVDMPWRRLIGAVAGPVAHRLPGVDSAVKTGRVLGRIQLQWPRPGAAYRTGLRATFASPERGRRPDCCLFVTLDASGLRAGAEVVAHSDAWGRMQGELGRRGWIEAAGDLRWSVAGEAWAGGDGADLARRLAAVRRGSVRLATAWTPEESVAAGAALAEHVGRALETAANLYEWTVGTRAPAGDPAAGMLPPAEPAPPAQVPGPEEAALPALPRGLRTALVRRAEEEGVTLDAFILYVLTRAAAG